MAASSHQLFPEIKWAQRKDRLFVTIELADFENQKIELTPEGQLKFQAESHGNVYGFDLALFEQVNVEASKWNTKGRNIILNIVKQNVDGDHWPRLTKDKVKNTHIQIDWAKWVDEDEENEAKPVGEDWNADNMNDFNMGAMGGMGGDSDDEEEEEEEQKHDHDHDHEGHGSEDPAAKKKANADLDDLDAEAEADTNNQGTQ